MASTRVINSKVQLRNIIGLTRPKTAAYHPSIHDLAPALNFFHT
jgi:hypothetical protein